MLVKSLRYVYTITRWIQICDSTSGCRCIPLSRGIPTTDRSFKISDRSGDILWENWSNVDRR